MNNNNALNKLNSFKIACGAFHNMALTRGGQDVLCWGINDYGQLGIGSTTYKMTPTKVIDLEGIEIISISAGGWHSMALASTGQNNLIQKLLIKI